MSENEGQPFTVGWAEAKLAEAKKWAKLAHSSIDQTYGPLPYEYHLQHVENVVQRFYKSDKPHTWYLRIGAWLHDMVEDTATPLSAIEAIFGKNISDLVWRVTDEEITVEEMKAGTKPNRKNRKAKTYPKISESELAVTLKLADRIANTENGHSWNTSLLDMYKKEYPDFKRALYNEEHCDKVKRMWAYLDLLIWGEYD